MDALNFLKFWRRATSNSEPHLGEKQEDGYDEDDSFFDLEFTIHTNEDGISKISLNPQNNTQESKDLESNNHHLPNEPISKRKILPLEHISKPQSPISLLKSAPSFRILMFKKNKETSHSKPEETEETEDFSYSPSLTRSASASKTHGSKSERFPKEVLQKYLKLIKPLYVKITGKSGEKVKLYGDLSSSFSASTTSSPAFSSVSMRREKHGNFRGGCKHLEKSKSASMITGIGSPARKSNDTLQLQYDGIQSAILHCKRSFNSRGAITQNLF